MSQEGPFVTHATKLGREFALPHFMEHRKCEDMKPTDNPTRVPIFHKVDNNHVFDLWKQLISWFSHGNGQYCSFPMETKKSITIL